MKTCVRFEYYNYCLEGTPFDCCKSWYYVYSRGIMTSRKSYKRWSRRREQYKRSELCVGSFAITLSNRGSDNEEVFVSKCGNDRSGRSTLPVLPAVTHRSRFHNPNVIPSTCARIERKYVYSKLISVWPSVCPFVLSDQLTASCYRGEL